LAKEEVLYRLFYTFHSEHRFMTVACSGTVDDFVSVYGLARCLK